MSTQDNNGDNGTSGAAGEKGGALFDFAATEDRIGALCHAPFGKNAQDFVIEEKGYGSPHSGDGHSGSVDGDGLVSVEKGGSDWIGVKFLPNDPMDSSSYMHGDDKGLKMTEVGNRQDESARLVQMFLANQNLPDAGDSCGVDEHLGERIKGVGS